MTDHRRTRKFAEKKTVAVSAAELNFAEVASTDAHELFELPDNALITHAYCDVKGAGQALLTVDFGFSGGNELGNDLDIDAVSVVGGELTAGIDTGTGKTVTAKFSAAPTAGDFVFIVQYIEYKLGTGMLTQYS